MQPEWNAHARHIDLPTGATLAYRDEGPASGDVVLLLHGFTNDASFWSDVAIGLRTRNPHLRIIAPDLRGHGSSTRPVDPALVDIEHMAADIDALVTELGIETVTLIGHSMGSLIAQHLALENPARFTRLILLASTSDARGENVVKSWLRGVLNEWQGTLEAKGLSEHEIMVCTPRDIDPSIVAWMQQFWSFYPLTPTRSTLAVAERCADLPLATWFGCAGSILTYHRDLTQISVPVLVIWGTQDAFFTRDDQDRLINALERSSARFAWKQYGHKPLPADGLQHDDLGHNLTWEIPDAIAEDIVSWLQEGVPTSRDWFVSPAGAMVSEPTGAPIRCTHPS